MKNRILLVTVFITLNALLLTACSEAVDPSLDERSSAIDVSETELTPLPEKVEPPPRELTPPDWHGEPPEGDPGSDPCDAPDAPAIHVPEDVESIAIAAEMLEEYGRVVVAPGEYHENIFIPPGVHIIIQSEGPENTALFPADGEIPLIQVASGARLCLEGLSIRGASVGLVLGSVDRGERALETQQPP